MKWLKTLTLLIGMLLAFTLAALVVNQQELTLTFATWETPFALSMFWWLLAAFLIGLSFGLLNSLWVNAKHRMQSRQLRKQLAQASAELDRLRSINV